MGRILCATRGGEGSRETVAAAITLARERGDDLIFLYVADASFLDRIAAPLVVNVESELEQMGRFQLAIAQEQATAEGVRSTAIVRHGQFQTELLAAARELGATLIILGRPQDGSGVFDVDGLQDLATRLKAETGIEVRTL